MVLFCALWVPCIFFCFSSLVRAGNIIQEKANFVTVSALLTGVSAGLARFFVPLIIDTPDGFGISRWLSAFVDYTAVPIIFPLIILFIFQTVSRIVVNDKCSFVLCALIPVALVRSIFYSETGGFIRLVLTPLLWTSTIVCLYPLFNLLSKNKIIKKTKAVFLIFGLLLITATCWWLFFCQHILYGAILLLLPIAGSVATVIFLYRNKSKRIT
ncbi:MAG: hypothetical protein Ta2F_02300 [Termitinemataceae bacterium]|nr:MAG: hypothetical protein Ta2F_02300 [Termitinemataceae bacterium]